MVVEGTVVEAAGVETTTVVLFKESDTTRIGIGLRADVPERAVVNTVAPESPAAQPLAEGSSLMLIQPYDELTHVGGTAVESAVHAVKLIREAPAGDLVIVKIALPESALRGVLMLQDSWRGAFARQEGLVRRILVKPTLKAMLGLSFSPEYAMHSIIKQLAEGGAAARALAAGDRVVRVNGVFCDAPSNTARLLRECEGRIELQVVPAAEVDAAEIAAAEEAHLAAERAEEEERERERAAAEAEEEEGEEEEEEEGLDDDELDGDDAVASGDGRYQPPRAANGTAGREDPFPSSRPAAVSGSARRLPPSLSSLSPGGPGPHSPVSPLEARCPRPTSTTRARVDPVLGAGGATAKKPEGWREWLAQRRTAEKVQPRDAPHTPPLNQRV